LKPEAPPRFRVNQVGATHSRISQRIEWPPVSGRREAAVEETIAFLEKHPGQRALVFVNTKNEAESLFSVFQSAKRGIEATVVHGDKDQSARQGALRDFRSGVVERRREGKPGLKTKFGLVGLEGDAPLLFRDPIFDAEPRKGAQISEVPMCCTRLF